VTTSADLAIAHSSSLPGEGDIVKNTAIDGFLGDL
jgi:hypothetical protein